MSTIDTGTIISGRLDTFADALTNPAPRGKTMNFERARATAGALVLAGLFAVTGCAGDGHTTTQGELAAMPAPTTVSEKHTYCQSYREAYDVDAPMPCALAVLLPDTAD